MGTVNGKRQKKEKGGFATKKEAEAALATALNQYNNAGTVFTPTEITVADYLDFWFDNYCKMNMKYNAQLGAIQVIEKHLKPKFGAYKLKALSAAQVQAYVNDLKLQGYAKSTVKSYLSVLSSALKYAVEPMHYIEFNLCERVKLPRYENGRQEMHVYIQPDDMRKILDRFADSDFYLPIMIGYHCGLRISECFGLTWDRIDLDARTLTIDRQIIKRNYGNDVRQSIYNPHRVKVSEWYFQTPKTGTSTRTIPFGNTLLQALKCAKQKKAKNRLRYGEYFTEYYLRPEKDEKNENIYRLLPVSRAVPTTLESADLVCVHENGTLLSPDSFKYPCRVINHDMHIVFNFHSLRHTHATMLVQAGANLKDIQARLGHADIRTTLDQYTHVTKEMQDQTVEIFEKVVNRFA